MDIARWRSPVLFALGGAALYGSIKIVQLLGEVYDAALVVLRNTGDVTVLYSADTEKDGGLMCEWVALNEGDSAWINIGLWNSSASGSTTSYSQAAASLASRLSEEARLPSLAPGSIVLDIGCGMGDSTLAFARTLPRSTRILGVNLSASQIEKCRVRATAAAIDCERTVEFLVADATATDLPAQSVHAVLALESPFHFNTRERFLGEASRLLTPGGTFAIADICLSRSGAAWCHWFVTERLSQFFCIPMANCVDGRTIVNQFEVAGFTDVHLTSIASDTFPGFLSFYYSRWRRRGGWQSASVRERAFYLLLSFGYGPLMQLTADYVIVTGRKAGVGGADTLRPMEGNVESAGARLGSSNETLHDVKAALAGAQTALADAQAALLTSQEECRAACDTIDHLQAHNDSLRNTLADLQESLVSSQEERRSALRYVALLDEQRAATAKAEGEAAALRDEVRRYSAREATLAKLVDEAADEGANLTVKSRVARSPLAASPLRRREFNAGEE